jgi:hypothetical protein
MTIVNLPKLAYLQSIFASETARIEILNILILASSLAKTDCTSAHTLFTFSTKLIYLAKFAR